MKSMTFELVILSFNEVEGLNVFLPKIAPVCRANGIKNCFAVDPGSKDGSLDLYNRYNIPVVIQTRRGRGEAFKLAFERSFADVLVFFSPDGNEDINDIAPLCRLIREGADMAIASRMMKGARNEEDASLFRPRKWVNQAFTLSANLLWNRRCPYITDTINGFRAIRRTAWGLMDVTASDFAVEFQSSIHAFKRGLRVAEIPTCEGSRIGGESLAKSWPTGVRFVKLLWREILAGKKFPRA